MGKFVTLTANRIHPSQDYLNEKTIEYILSCFRDDDLDSLPPPPIVRKADKKDEYIAIDGHNLIAVCDFLGIACLVYIAENRDDGLPENHDPKIKQRNIDLHDKFSIRRSSLTVRQLQQKYPTLTE